MMRPNIMVIGAGGVGTVAVHKCAQNNDCFGDICFASRTRAKCEKIIEDVYRKSNIKDTSKRLYAKQIDAENVSDVVALIKDTDASIVLNAGSPFVNMPIMDACLEAGAAYIDTAVHEDTDVINAEYPWYAEFEWKRKNRFKDRKLTAILSVGFDPGVVNAYSAYAQKHEFSKIHSIDIMDVNAGDHGRFFATNFDPETNLREILEDAGYMENGDWKTCKRHSRSITFEFPEIGKHKLYLMGHEEIHSLSVNLDVGTIRFWMGFSDHYLNCFNVLHQIGLLNHKTVRTAEGIDVVPLKVLKACLPDPTSLASDYSGKTCIGNLIRGENKGVEKEIFIYNICDHETCFEEMEAQAISFTAGVPPAAAAILLARGDWDVKKMVNVEELDPDPFIALLDTMGLPTQIKSAEKSEIEKDK